MSPRLIFLNISIYFFYRKRKGKILHFCICDLVSEVFSERGGRVYGTEKNPERFIIYVELSTFGAGGICL